MQEKIKRTGTLMGGEFESRTKPMGPPPFDAEELRRLREVSIVEQHRLDDVPYLDGAGQPTGKYAQAGGGPNFDVTPAGNKISEDQAHG
jgi:hypothetical protein